MPDLPRIIPLFPLPNLVLFPGVVFPLYIFEPRYRQMVADVSASHGIVGMMLLKDDWEGDYYGHPDIFAVGCAGRVETLVKLPDGRCNLLLNAISEFRVLREIRDRPYRQAEVEWCPVGSSELELNAEAMEGLRELLFSYLGDAATEVWESLLSRAPRGAALVNFLCFHLDVPAIEKQTMLEAGAKRIECLFDVLSFRLEEYKLGRYGPGGSSGMVQ